MHIKIFDICPYLLKNIDSSTHKCFEKKKKMQIHYEKRKKNDKMNC